MKRILIIEDDLVIANIYSNKFRIDGYQVEVAHDGQTGIDQLAKFKPDILILDLSLPKVSGIDVMKRCRANPESKAVPIIVFSNLYLSTMVQEAWKAGATKCLSKIDCTPTHLIEVVKGCLGAAEPPPAPAQPPPASYQAQPYAGAPPPGRPAAPAYPAGGAILPEHDTDEAFQADLRKTFLEGGPQTSSSLRSLLMGFSKSETDAQRLAKLQDLARQVRLLSGNAAMVGFTHMARLAAALEALLKELYEKPKNINASTLRTVAHTLDFFSVLFERGISSEAGDLATASVLVVDDEVISRRAVVHSLDRAGLKSVSVEDPQIALQLLEENTFDLVILDVEMPGLDGFELCSRLRAIPKHSITPVIFVTSHSDFESRAKSIMSGGNDLIGKPFVFMELAVKALTHVLRPRLLRNPAHLA